MYSTVTFQKMKKNQEKITMMTAYDAPSAQAVERAGMDLILVGDSAGMVVHGYDSTIPVTMDDMVLHTKAVRRGAPDTFVVTDMPFLSCHERVDQTVRNARRLMQEGGAHAVKLEGGQEVVDAVQTLVKGGVPVMGHLGLTPQSVGVLGGYKIQGKTEKAAKQLITDCFAIEEAGVFALVLECVPARLAAYIARQLTIPVIGIGAGVDTDGQVLVFHDVIGYGGGRVPSFVKTYADVDSVIDKALRQYVNEVKAINFPQSDHQFEIDDEVMDRIEGMTIQ